LARALSASDWAELWLAVSVVVGEPVVGGGVLGVGAGVGAGAGGVGAGGGADGVGESATGDGAGAVSLPPPPQPAMPTEATRTDRRWVSRGCDIVNLPLFGSAHPDPGFVTRDPRTAGPRRPSNAGHASPWFGR
jgi:hypothetical protein